MFGNYIYYKYYLSNNLIDTKTILNKKLLDELPN